MPRTRRSAAKEEAGEENEKADRGKGKGSSGVKRRKNGKQEEPSSGRLEVVFIPHEKEQSKRPTKSESRRKVAKSQDPKSEKESSVEEKKEPAPSELDHDSDDWISGKNDVRGRGAKLCRILGELYRLRWSENDRFKMIHWRKVAVFLDEFPDPILTQNDVESLIEHKGIGKSTVNVLLEVQMTGYVDWIDDLLAEVQNKFESLGIIADDKKVTMEMLEDRVERMSERSAEERRRNRERLANARRRDLEAKYVDRIEKAVNSGLIITGKERRLMVEKKREEQENGKESSKLESLEEEEMEGRYPTRGILRRKKIHKALIAAANADDLCVICMEPYADESQLVVYECQHCFHMPCIQDWLASRLSNGVQPSCPLCRRPIAIPR